MCETKTKNKDFYIRNHKPSKARLANFWIWTIKKQHIKDIICWAKWGPKKLWKNETGPKMLNFGASKPRVGGGGGRPPEPPRIRTWVWCDTNFYKCRILFCIFHLNHLVYSYLIRTYEFAAQFIIFLNFIILWNILLNNFLAILISH